MSPLRDSLTVACHNSDWLSNGCCSGNLPISANVATPRARRRENQASASADMGDLRYKGLDGAIQAVRDSPLRQP